MILLGLASPRHHWDWSCQEWPHWDSAQMASVGQWRRDSPGMTSSQGHWDWSCWDGLARMASGWPGLARMATGWPHRNSTGVASPTPVTCPCPHRTAPFMAGGTPALFSCPVSPHGLRGAGEWGNPLWDWSPPCWVALDISALGEALDAGGLCSAAGWGLNASLCTSSFPPLKFRNP